MRYNNTERLGVIETDRIVTKYIGWIFREQPIIDVGLDAIIEQSIDGNPTGKFIALQIKSGAGNFHLSENKIVHYVSHIHYNYWLNLDIPIILVAHFPDTEKTFWQVINEHTFKKTKKKWKIEIPTYQEFNEKSKPKLTKILSNNYKTSFAFELYKGKIEPETLYDIIENMECISECTNSVMKIVDLIYELKDYTDNFNAKLNIFSSEGLSDKDFKVIASIKGFGRTLNQTSKRLENEIELYSQLFSEGFYAYEKAISINYLITNDKQKLESAKQSIETIPIGVDSALSGLDVMREGVFSLPKKYSVLKEARALLLDVLDLMSIELNESKQMAERMINSINNQK